MNDKRKFKRADKWKTEKTAYSIVFKRFNFITLICGLLFIFLAIINIPFLYNPETGEIAFTLSGKPTFGFGAALSSYVFFGLIPAIVGVIFVIFSIVQSRKVIFLMNKNGTCQYIKSRGPKLLPKSQVEIEMKGTLQQINLGKRHQRFVIWVSVAIMFFLIYLILDYMNFLDPTFDIITTFYETEYSVKLMLLINVFYIIGTIIPYTLFPRKSCRVDTSIEFIQFDYTKIYVEEVSKSEEDLPHVKPFILLSKNMRVGEEDLNKELVIPEHYPDILKTQINTKNFKHLPLFTILTNLGLFLIVFVPLLLPNYFLGGFTIRIEFFIIIAAFYFFVRNLQNNWYSSQNIEATNNNLLVFRKNKIYGDSVTYFQNVDKAERSYAPRKPHFFEYVLFFFPIIQMVWVVANIISFPVYFFTQNIYTLLYIPALVGILFFTATEYILPRSMMSITPKAQGEKRKNEESFSIYFPGTQIFKAPPIRYVKKHGFKKNSTTGILLIVIPIIVGIVWVILSLFGILPHISETIF